MAKLILCIVLILACGALGCDRANRYKAKTETVKNYLKLSEELESAVRNFKSVNSYLENTKFSQNALDGNFENNEERTCAEMMNQAILIANTSSDAESVAREFAYLTEKLKKMQREVEEENSGKIKTVPYLYTVAGIFIAVMVL